MYINIGHYYSITIDVILNRFWFAKHITFFSLDRFKETCSMTSMVILIKKDLKPKLVHYYH